MSTVIVDANLLCLIVAGTFAPDAIGRHKRLRAYQLSDFHKVMEITEHFSSAVTCPNILTETSNLLSNTNDYERALLLSGLQTLVDETVEVHTPSSTACQSHFYLRLGLTDAVLLTAQIDNSTIFTVDLGLVLAAQEIGRRVVNYNWVRDEIINLEAFGIR